MAAQYGEQSVSICIAKAIIATNVCFSLDAMKLYSTDTIFANVYIYMYFENKKINYMVVHTPTLCATKLCSD